MNNQILLIYEFEELFNILDEFKNELNFKIVNILKSNLENFDFDENSTYLLLTKEEDIKFDRQILINDFPIKIERLLEKINIKFLSQKFNNQSEIKVGKYKIDINSREIRNSNNILKLTEKECDIIIYLLKSKNSVTINDLQLNVWDHQSKLETHTVETHIYRLRKKILKKFQDNEFIKSEKDGYQIK